MTITVMPEDASSGAPTYSAQHFRQTMSSLMGGGSGHPLGARSGKRPGGGLEVTLSGSTYSVAPGACVIDPEVTTQQGPYLCASDAVVSGSLTPATSATRTDIVYFHLNDQSAGDGSGALSGQILYQAGSTTLPARSLLLATITVPPTGGGSPTVVDNDVFSTAAGGIRPVGSSAQDSPSPYLGEPEFDPARGGLLLWDGAEWMSYGNPPRFVARMPDVLYISSATSFPFTVIEDPFSGWDGTNHRWVVPRSGLYSISGQFVAESPIEAIMSVKVNGTQRMYSPGAVQSVSTDNGGATLAGMLRLSAGDLLTVESSNTWTTSAEPGVGTSFSALWVAS